MAFLKKYRVIAKNSIVLEEPAGNTISYEPNSVFQSSPRNPSIVKHLELENIIEETVGGTTSGYIVVAGPIGPAGPTGLTGPAGAPGADGIIGVDGAPGPAGPTYTQEQLTISSNGQTVFTISQDVQLPLRAFASTNSGIYLPTIHFTLGGAGNRTFTWLNLFPLDTQDELVVFYFAA